jgi:parallel beta-helix repeat protein
LAFTKMSDFTFKHVNQPDNATVPANTAKANFDSRGNELRTALNNLIDELNSKILSDVPANAVFTDTVTTVDNTLTSTSATDALSANQGKVLKDAADAHKADGTQHAKTARFVIGTSTAGWTAADCDYLCDGTADDVHINSAITALPAAGGEIVILDGTYNITAKINVTKDNVSIRGNGNATILKRMWSSSVAEGVITLTSVTGCKVVDLQIDGNKSAYSSYYNRAIYLYSSSNNTVTGNTCNNNSYGIYLDSSNNNTVTGNTCNNNSCGIYLDFSSNNTVTGNTCNNNSNYGILLDFSSNDNTVTGNTCNNNSCGILLYSSSNNTVTGNTCIRGIGLTSDYAANQYTIRLGGTTCNYNLISSNNCMGKAVTVEGGTSNTEVNNKWQ